MRDTRQNRPGKALAIGLALACLGLAALGLSVSGWGADLDARGVLRRLAPLAREAGGERLALCLCVYWLLGSLAINCPFPLAGALKTGGGFLFGAAAGSAVNMAMTAAGAAVGFAISRRFLRGRLTGRPGNRLAAMDAALAKDGFWYVLFCRLALVFPFSGVNVACGLSGMTAKKFLWATFLGDAPVAVMYAVAGSALSRWSLEGVAPSGRMAALLAILAVAALIPPLAARGGFLKKAFGRRPG
ncbi:MAG: TVP38/TMEM64 family protein [Desulfovibrionaceae bacterium]|nr:TVP38/TMEM64 family protein [Desulfovibrionaceae bacterium]MBF0514686.1 TVP38/TMEM64 family protein [Desulfovibrionaceae bacterium]